MKILLSLFALVTVSGAAFAQTESTPTATTNATKPAVPSTPIFKDVPPNHWAFAAVQRLASAGIIEGYASTAAPTTQTVAKVAPSAKVASPLASAAILAPKPPVQSAAKAKATTQPKTAPKLKTPTKNSN